MADQGEITFTWDKGEIRRFQGGRVEKAATRALRKAGRDALRAMKTASQRSVRFRRRIGVSRVNAGLPTRASGQEMDDLEWRMDVSGAPMRLVDYPYSSSGRGVRVGIKTGNTVLIRSAFEAKMKSGHVGIFMRRGKSRLPIDELYSTKLSDVFQDSGMVPAVMSRALSAFSTTFDRVFPLELEK